MTTSTPLDELYKRILRWVYVYPLPNSGFDALQADERTLASYGLPARPDRRLVGEAGMRFWERMVGPGTRFERPTFPEADVMRVARFAVQRREPERARADHVAGFHHRSNSRNWSGACITPTRPNRFTQITGSWVVPDVSVPSILPIGAHALNEDFRSSTWIGIGGHRPYNSLPQVGTGQHIEVSGGTRDKHFFAWWQWWVKDCEAHHVPVPIMNFPVTPGDRMLASLTIEASRDVMFHLKNETQQSFVAFKVTAPAGIETLGASAEWVHERPTQFRSDRMYPLPRCETVTFSDCRAVSIPVHGGKENVQTLSGARVIRMVEVFDKPHRSALISVPVMATDTQIHLNYIEAKA